MGETDRAPRCPRLLLTQHGYEAALQELLEPNHNKVRRRTLKSLIISEKYAKIFYKGLVRFAYKDPHCEALTLSTLLERFEAGGIARSASSAVSRAPTPGGGPAQRATTTT